MWTSPAHAAVGRTPHHRSEQSVRSARLHRPPALLDIRRLGARMPATGSMCQGRAQHRMFMHSRAQARTTDQAASGRRPAQVREVRSERNRRRGCSTIERLKPYRLLPVHVAIGCVFGVFGVLAGVIAWGVFDQIKRRRQGTWSNRRTWSAWTATRHESS